MVNGCGSRWLCAFLFGLLLLGCRGPGLYPSPTAGLPGTPDSAALTQSPAPSPTVHRTPSPTPVPTAVPTPTPTQVPPTPAPAPASPTATPTAPVETARVVTRLPTTEPVIALTFDCGADRGYAEQILDELAGRGIQATFGMTGAWARANPDLVARMLREGHVLVNHSNTHPSFTGYSTGSAALSPEERVSEIRAAEEAVAPVSGSLATMRPFFRPPYGDYDDALLELLPQLGYDFLLLWTIDSLGWRGIPPEDIVQRVSAAAEPGTIVLLHVGAQSTDALALPGLLDTLEAAGYRFVTVRDIL